MVKIRRLPDTLVNRIAAGEVVERPASALKELVENAIDAGARTISVVLEDGGLAGIEVTDDGIGMTREDITLALQRHATSKLPEELLGEGEALEGIATLGFRGEALPSIASVARLEIASRPRDAAEGWRQVVDNGAVVVDEPAALPPGTRVRVSEIFARIPARRKFLRTARSEFMACRDVVRRLAMARPDVGFTLENDGRRVIAVQPGEALQVRVSRLIARELADNSVLLDFSRGERDAPLRLTGIAGLPTYNRGVADHQYLFVNGRPVKDRLLTGAVRGAYADMLARDRHAVLALFVDVPAPLLDINVHPAKTEVRFRDPAAVRSLIVSGLRDALSTGDRRSAQGPERGAMARWQREGDVPAAPPAPAMRSIFAGEGWNNAVHEKRTPFAYREMESAILAPEGRRDDAIGDAPDAQEYPLGVARGQIDKTYIVAEAADGLVIVDQHAAHERLTLERLRAAGAGEAQARSQALLMP